jgi:hypothetical protein
MEIALVLRELWGRKRWLVAGVLVSLVCAVYSVDRIHLFPPKLVARNLQYSSASVQVIVDTPNSFVGNMGENVSAGIDRATIFANLMASPGAMDVVGRYAGIPGDEIWAAGPVDPTQQRVVVEPTATKRDYQVAGESLPYRIEFLTDPTLPIISVYTQAPSTAQALALANGSVSALSLIVHQQQSAQSVPADARVTIRTIGPANGGVVNAGITKKLAALVFVAVLVGWCVLVLLLVRLRANWRRSAVSGRPLALGDHDLLERSWRASAPPEPEYERAGGVAVPASGGGGPAGTGPRAQ